MNFFAFAFPAFVVCQLIVYGLREMAFRQLSAEQVGVVTLAIRALRLKVNACIAGTFIVFLALYFALPDKQNLLLILFLGVLVIAALYFVGAAGRSYFSLIPSRTARMLEAAHVVIMMGWICGISAFFLSAF